MLNISQLCQQISKLYNQKEDALEKHPFYRQLQSLQNVPRAFEDASLQDYALSEILPLDVIYSKAESAAAKQDAEWGLQDYVIIELLDWFKNDFFTWVNTLPCSKCQSTETQTSNVVSPSYDERVNGGASQVEIHKCLKCGNEERFPRYNKLRRLLEYRKGRCGEFANCFSFLCRALGTRTRYVWNAEDHVWTEVYSERQQRWVHCDACENAFDKPDLYERGWGKSMSYCIGFSVEGVADVSKRYVTDRQLPRKRISEFELRRALKKLTAADRQYMPKDEVAKLEKEDRMEKEQLFGSPATTSEVGPRESGAGAWTRERGEDGSAP